ncbi:MAG: NAD(P)H-binding protein [Solirubrobacteraceae bacterium]|nr:NAD(P)H-binding protein [Solirubrobacteraceae bacterium]
MLLLTGATGLVGRSLLRRLAAAGEPVRCLVRDPRRLGSDRVRVQIALGDLADPPSFRNAMRGVRTVVHLAAAIRDQPAGSIEELNGIATWRMVQAAERAGVEHFVFMSSLGAFSHDRTRHLRAKALAERAVLASDVRHTVFAPSLVYAPGDMFLTLLERMALLLPVMPVSGRGQAVFQPIWAEDVADAIAAAIGAEAQPAAEPRAGGVADERRPSERGERYELAGPQTLTHREIVDLVVRAGGRTRRLVSVPTPLVSRGLRLVETIMQSRAPATWDEAELLEVSMIAPRGTADAEALGVTPRTMAAVLGA